MDLSVRPDGKTSRYFLRHNLNSTSQVSSTTSLVDHPNPKYSGQRLSVSLTGSTISLGFRSLEIPSTLSRLVAYFHPCHQLRSVLIISPTQDRLKVAWIAEKATAALFPVAWDPMMLDHCYPWSASPHAVQGQRGWPPTWCQPCR